MAVSDVKSVEYQTDIYDRIVAFPTLQSASYPGKFNACMHGYSDAGTRDCWLYTHCWLIVEQNLEIGYNSQL